MVNHIMSSEQVDLTKVTNDAELITYAPAVLLTKTKSFFFRYQQFIYGFVTGATVVIASRMARKSLF
jgi:hypothetical protein